MKFLSKLFLVAASIAVVSCTTDVTEDLGVVVGGQTEVVLSLEASRTQLGEKADGIYPLYWSEGDQISINGIASSPIAAEDAGAAAAKFTIDGVLSYPYNVVYPAASANEVVFLEKQSYTEGSFAQGAAPMYGYAESANSAIQMRHLAGALRFDISGTATLSKVVVTAESGSLAGTFAVDCASGELVAVEGKTSNTASLHFGAGLALTSTPTPIYLAVPAGSYGKVSVDIYSTAGEVMATQFDTTSKPVSVGMVREFAPITYNGKLDTSDFVIDSKEALIAFAANPTKSAIVTADIDMSGYDWTPIEGFENLTFDGGNFEIKGLNAPLFGAATNVIVKNVCIVDSNIKITKSYAYTYKGETTQRVYAGALAYYIWKGEIMNCSTSGKIEIDMVFTNADTTMESSNTYAISIGGVVGLLRDLTTITKLTNHVDITITSLFGAMESSQFYTSIAGVCGHAAGTATINECYNYGDVTFVPNQGTNKLRMGGIFGYCPALASGDRLENYGDLTSNVSTTADQYIGGVVARPNTATDFTNCKSCGAITIGADVTLGDEMNLGIFAGSNSKGTTLTNCVSTNNAEGKGITLACDCVNIYVGLVGRFPTSSKTLYNHAIVNCTNSMDMHLTSDFSATDSCYLTFGSAENDSDANTALNITNYTNSGNILFEGQSTSYLALASMIGYWRTKSNSKHALTITDSTNKGNITVTGKCCYRPCIGGFIGYNSATYVNLTNIQNKGNITVNNAVDGTLTNWTSIGGIIAYDGQKTQYTKCVNSGNITVTGNYEGEYKSAAVPLRVGGIVGYTISDLNFNEGMANTGNITVGAEGVTTSVKQLFVGGLWGESTKEAPAVVMVNPTNTGNITVTNVTNANVEGSYIGGIIGRLNVNVSNAQCYAEIRAKGYTNVGWIMGAARSANSKAVNCKVGGYIRVIDEEDESESIQYITEADYFNYIYGNGINTDWSDTDNYDGCTVLTEKPVINL